MRKKFLSFVLIISILSSLFAAFPMVASAAGSSELPVNISSVYCYYEEGEIKAAIGFNTVTEGGTAFLAVYDGEKFINIGQDTFNKDKKAKMVKLSGADESYIGLEARIFCWGRDNSLIPIATSFRVQITDYMTELVRRLTAVSDEIDIYTARSNSTFTNQEKTILNKINECIDDAVANHAEELTADFIKNNYEGSVEEKKGIEYVKSIYEDLEANGKAERFKSALATNFAVDNLIWLADTLGIDLSSYGINKEDYI